jgi:hypothetical protein
MGQGPRVNNLGQLIEFVSRSSEIYRPLDWLCSAAGSGWARGAVGHASAQTLSRRLPITCPLSGPDSPRPIAKLKPGKGIELPEIGYVSQTVPGVHAPAVLSQLNILQSRSDPVCKLAMFRRRLGDRDYGSCLAKLARKLVMIRKGIELPEIGYVSQTVPGVHAPRFFLN